MDVLDYIGLVADAAGTDPAGPEWAAVTAAERELEGRTPPEVITAAAKVGLDLGYGRTR